MVPPVISLMNHRSITWISIQSTMEYGAAYRGPHESRVAGSEYRFRPFPSLAPRHFRMPQGAYVHTCLIHALRAKGRKRVDGQSVDVPEHLVAPPRWFRLLCLWD